MATASVPPPADRPIHGKPEHGWRRRVYEVIFEADTPGGRSFDQALIWTILLSVLIVMADSVESIVYRFGAVLAVLEWIFTILFTVEYIGRLFSVQRPIRYATSFFGIVDLLAILPSYLSLFVPGLQFLTGIRVLRLLRIFRVFKLPRFMDEYQMLGRALKASHRKILVFLSVVSLIVLTMGTVMYVVEGPEHGFTSIPAAIYWAISTITTVGFGDITPQTPLGRSVASLMMLLGWGILAVPTGIFTVEMSMAHALHAKRGQSDRQCGTCNTTDHDADASFCKHCSARLPKVQSP